MNKTAASGSVDAFRGGGFFWGEVTTAQLINTQPGSKSSSVNSI